jgi:ComF family protein
VNARVWFDQFVRLGADLVFPPQCSGCGQIGAIFCPRCAQSVEMAPPSVCSHCGRIQPTAVPLCSLCQEEDDPPLTLTRAAAIYTDPLRSAIHALKYEGKAELGAPLSRYLVAIFQRPPWTELTFSFDGCIPVPLHPKRYKERGYNQAALLASGFSKWVKIPLRERWLARSRETASQVTLSAEERRKNTADAFIAPPDVAGKRLLVIDDVTTTGATLTACAHALRKAGAATICGLALATPHRDGSTNPRQMTG